MYVLGQVLGLAVAVDVADQHWTAAGLGSWGTGVRVQSIPPVGQPVGDRLWGGPWGGSVVLAHIRDGNEAGSEPPPDLS